MVSKVNGSVNIEVFELSPLNEAAITTKGRLQRCFPGAALRLSMEVFQESNFQKMFASTLAKMSCQRAAETTPKARKAGQMHDETRDTTHPKMVTELFMGVLRSVGAPANVSHQWKNTREEIMYHKGLLPWRRSSLWLLIRVALQLVFSRLASSPNASQDLYKMYMAFLLSYVLELAHAHSLPSEHFYAMNAKLARRLMKLGSPAAGSCFDFIRLVMTNTDSLIRARWSNILNHAAPHYDLARVRCLNFSRDFAKTLSSLDEYIELLPRRRRTESSAEFQPEFHLTKYQAAKLPGRLLCSSEEYKIYDLLALENWVASSLQEWLSDHKGHTDTCGKLGDLMQKYHEVASRMYSGHPEAVSRMLLNILELWIACDKSATHICELLKDYDPGISQQLLQSLLLPFKSQMERLDRAEVYLDYRQARAQFKAPSIIRDFGRQNCFSVRYFEQSREHKDLMKTIELQARHAREEKYKELDQKQGQYRELMKLHRDSTCEYQEVVTDHYNGFSEERHSGNCRKCRYLSRANSIDIGVHEWPLPSDSLQARSTVFELDVPNFFGCWRDTTVVLLVDILQAEYLLADEPQTKCPLSSYCGLSSFFTSFSSAQRIGLLSHTKPHEVTHRRIKLLGTTTRNDVCVNNGMSYRYYDSRTNVFVAELHVKDGITKLCTHQLSEQSKSIQQFLSRPPAAPSGPSPNTVIASQSACPHHMSLDEYKALCTVSLGYRIQWQNILVQLATPTVDFNKAETGLVVLQCIQQTGPSQFGNVLRAGHRIGDEEKFANTFLKSLHESLERIRENWESSQALSTFISLAARILSLTSTDQVREICLSYLTCARAVALGWINVLKSKVAKTETISHRMELMYRSVELALICANSFNVEERHLQDILTNPEDASILIQCSVLIQENTLAVLKASDYMVNMLHQRWKSLSHKSYPILAEKILHENDSSLDDAILHCWPAYIAGSGWSTVSEKIDYWLVSYTGQQNENERLCVHFNLLTGELLVNGQPLARLPQKYEQHSTYRTLFGHCILDVMPSGVQGMQFCVRHNYAGYTIHLGIDSHSNNVGSPKHDLLVQVLKDNQKYEFVPPRLLRGNVPEAFVDNFVHWYDIANDCVEFRSIDDPWTSSTNNWRLTRVKYEFKWQLVKQGMSLISLDSETARQVSGILSPIEDLLWMHVIFNHSSSLVEIDLPRLRLAFYLKSGESSIQSRQFRGMVIDVDQSVGTLAGLCNKLILKDKSTSNRLLIIPEGSVSYERHENHVHVHIDKSSATKAHAYLLDGQLGRLVDNGSLQSKLLLCFLHALTSFCLPDPFTQNTGTEQALSILKSAAVRSFRQLASENVALLCRIAKLTPGRSFYPLNERVMQTVEWSPAISFLSQHADFYNNVKIIFEQDNSAKTFYPESYIPPPTLKHVEVHLLERDCIRSSTFRVSGFGAEDHTVHLDVIYKARDRNQNSEQGSRAFILSSIIYQGRTALQYKTGTNLRAHIWNFLSKTHKILGPNHPLQPSELMYDASLLLYWCEFVSEHWCSIHQALAQADSNFDKFNLMTWFATLAFAKDMDTHILQTLASFFTMRDMAQVPPPQMTSFDLSQGAELKKGTLSQSIRSALRPMHLCPAGRLSALPGETQRALKRRRQSEFQERQSIALDTLLDALQTQWPHEVPVAPADNGSGELYAYVNVHAAVESVKPIFKTCFNNHLFYEYLGQVEKKLKKEVVARVTMIGSSSNNIFAWTTQHKKGFISTNDLFSGPAPSLLTSGVLDMTDHFPFHADLTERGSRLATLIQHLEAQARSRYERKYVEDLRESLISLQKRPQDQNCQPDRDGARKILLERFSRCKKHAQNIYDALLSAIGGVKRDGNMSPTPTQDPSRMAAIVSQWPRSSPNLFLQQLTRSQWPKLSEDWKHCIVQYGLALTELQRTERLISLVGSNADFSKELRNVGHTNWDPINYPESLLLEVESGIMIRDVQESIAKEMRNPISSMNAVMQLNMGEGKSSVIVPIVVAALANGSRLVRVVVGKPQSKQMFQMLISKLGGLLNRRVYHLPFSRSLRLGKAEADAIGRIYRECMEEGGVLLLQPEHILSFKLMCLENLISGKEEAARSLLMTQEFFDKSSRDIVDESDENFSVKFELVYTMGMQQPTELSPERWNCIHQVLELVKIFGTAVEKELPSSVEINKLWPGGFPRTRILQLDAQQRLNACIAERICQTGLNGFPIARQPDTVRKAVFRYITVTDLTTDDVAQVEEQGPEGFWGNSTKGILLLLRGLMAGGVLSFVFGQKRWRVNYGLDATREPRTKLAVPYRAKDNPTLRSEFSHPDVVIVLTCLSYYYGGLENDDLFLAFEHLLNSDHADIEYQTWVKDAPNLPTPFHQLIGINLKDHYQCIEQVLPPLRFAKSVIDYFLTHIVFPKEMKEFPHKLTASGWDLGQTKIQPTTGFSGTLDSRNTLPLGVQYLDLSDQKHTNALVLEHLLQPENSVALMPPREKASGSDAELLVKMVVKMEPPTRVILDVGAQVLELNNLGVAREWLKLMPDDRQTQAALFFNEYDEISVLDRHGRVEPLQTSAFAKQLDLCLIFLDEIHTRGTDLKLPQAYRAAVTLGANLTKDRLVQGTFCNQPR
jgi:hypothetical protein